MADIDVPRTFITYARRMSLYGCYEKAFDFYLLAFENNDSLRSPHESEFRVVLIKLNESLVRSGKVDEIFANFEKAINIFPKNGFLFNDIGKYLYKFGYYTVAWGHFQNALKVDSGFVDAEKNLNSVKNFLVERWHFRMLNDRIRNEAYHAAIVESVEPGEEHVLDVGTGTGLLALFASECAPRAITACEGSDAMAKLAEVIMQENKAQNVAIINKMSTDLDYNEIGGKPTLLVTEVFDSGLLGEHVLQSISHAWDNLLASSARVIPYGAEFFVTAAKCDHLHMKYQLTQTIKHLLGIPEMAVHALTDGDTYDCTDVNLFKDVTYMTDDSSVLKINFNNSNDIQGIMQQQEPVVVPLTAIHSGEINIIVGWFNLHLTENIMITTNPKSENRAVAWQQAVFLDFVPTNLEQNEILEARFLINGGKLTLQSDNSCRITRISPETLRFLNDLEYTKKITDCIGTAYVYLGQMMDFSHVDIADLCPFPLFGLLMLKRGANSLICSAKSPTDKKFFKKVFKANNIPLSKIKILVGNDWTIESFGKEKYHAIFGNAFELCGDIDIRQHEIAYNLKCSHLDEAGLFLPARVHVMGQLVDSPCLARNNRVYDQNVCGYKIADYLNKFQVSQDFCLDFTTIEYTELSAPTILGTTNFTIPAMPSEVITIPIIKDGNANAILCWYSIELVKDLGEVQTNRSDSFINGMAFLADPKVRTRRGRVSDVFRCVDNDGSFKLMIDMNIT